MCFNAFYVKCSLSAMSRMKLPNQSYDDMCIRLHDIVTPPCNVPNNWYISHCSSLFRRYIQHTYIHVYIYHDICASLCFQKSHPLFICINIYISLLLTFLLSIANSASVEMCIINASSLWNFFYINVSFECLISTFDFKSPSVAFHFLLLLMSLFVSSTWWQ